MDVDGIKRPAMGRSKQTHQKTKIQPQTRGYHGSLSVKRGQNPFSTSVKRHTFSKIATPASAVIPPKPLVSLPVVVPDHFEYDLPAYQAAQHPHSVIRHRRRWFGLGESRKGLVMRAVAVCFVLVMTVGGLLTWNGYVKMHKVFRGTSMVAALAPKTVKPQLLNGEGDGRVNIVLLGIGGQGHDGPDLTDTIILLSVDPVNNTASMISIPRDLWVEQPIPYFGRQQKINAVYESGKYSYLGKQDSSNTNAAAIEAGFSNLNQVIEKVTGVTVNYHVLVDFQAFRQAIDTVDGVDINVPTNLIDPTMAWENNDNRVLAQPGLQHMNGVQALLYARSRETTSDFARSQRQRQILVALKDKVLTAGTLSNPAKIEALMNAFGDNIYSDMSTQGAERLYSILKNIGDGKISSLDLTNPPHQLIRTGRAGDLSIDQPVAGLNNYTDIQSYVRSQLPDGYIVEEHAPVAVLAGTNDAVTATANLLKSYGYDVTTTATTSSSVQKLTLVDLSNGTAPFTLHYLENRYGVTPVTELPAGVSVPQRGAKFVIIEP